MYVCYKLYVLLEKYSHFRMNIFANQIDLFSAIFSVMFDLATIKSYLDVSN